MEIITGYKHVLQMDVNPNSPTYGQTREILVQDETNCPVPSSAPQVVGEWCEMDIEGYTGYRIINYYDDSSGEYTEERVLDTSCTVTSTEENWVNTGVEFCEKVDGEYTGNLVIMQRQMNWNLPNYGEEREYKVYSLSCQSQSCPHWVNVSSSCHIYSNNCSLLYDGTEDVLQIDDNENSDSYNTTRLINVESTSCTNCTNTTFSLVNVGDFCGSDLCQSGITGDYDPSSSYNLKRKYKTISGTAIPMDEYEITLLEVGGCLPDRRVRWIDTDDTVCIYQEDSHLNEYLTLEVVSGGTLKWERISKGSCSNTREISYTKEGLIVNGEQQWYGPTSGININVSAGEKYFFRGLNEEYGNCCMWHFGGTAKFNAYGNIMSMIYGDDFSGQTALTQVEAFNGFFYGSGVVDASNLILPTMDLTRACYAQMFQNCTSLTAAPSLPATNLASNCYAEMFDGCRSLTTAPQLPATTLQEYCYAGMFRSCSGLTTAPELPADTMVLYCYLEMFHHCTSLTTAPELPATTLGGRCYQQMFQDCTSLTTAPELPATVLTIMCYYYMFEGCTSLRTAPDIAARILATQCCQAMFSGCESLTTPPVLSATTMAAGCYQEMFSGCTSLVNAPHLPAMTLANHCYDSMFKNCSSLVNAPALPATELKDYCYQQMFNHCTSLTTAPDLPAQKLKTYCYTMMFYECSNLNYIKCLATNNCGNCSFTQYWVYHVASSGTFVKDANKTWSNGKDGIPNNWTIQNA